MTTATLLLYFAFVDRTKPHASGVGTSSGTSQWRFPRAPKPHSGPLRLELPKGHTASPRAQASPRCLLLIIFTYQNQPAGLGCSAELLLGGEGGPEETLEIPSPPPPALPCPAHRVEPHPSPPPAHLQDSCVRGMRRHAPSSNFTPAPGI